MKIDTSLLAVDAIGALAVAGCVGVGVWLGLLNADGTSARISDLAGKVGALDGALAEVRPAVDAQRVAHGHLEAELGDRDLLPEGVPVERDLRAITALARRNRLDLIEFTPAGSQVYPGVLELRYKLNARASFTDYVAFLRDFEANPSWADITYLKLQSPDTQSNEGKPGELTVSLYSAIRERT